MPSAFSHAVAAVGTVFFDRQASAQGCARSAGKIGGRLRTYSPTPTLAPHLLCPIYSARGNLPTAPTPPRPPPLPVKVHAVAGLPKWRKAANVGL
jgi:hypothetical protein